MTGSRPVLVVDDDEYILDFVRMALEDEGYEVIVAAHGGEAMEKLLEIRPCLILLDMRMPHMNGWEFASAYRSAYQERSPIVVMTAGRDAEEKASEVSAMGYIGKPFELEDLIQTVKKYALNGAADFDRDSTGRDPKA